MFLFKPFLKADKKHVASADGSGNAVVDMSNEPGEYVPGSLRSPDERVLTVMDNDTDDFSEVQYRPLTYAEVASLSCDKNAIKQSKIQVPADIYDDPEEEPEEELEQDVAEEAGEYDEEPSSLASSVVLGSTNACNQDVISELEYGERVRTEVGTRVISSTVNKIHKGVKYTKYRKPLYAC